MVFNTSIIEVVLGLILVFALLALLVTQINTLLTNLLNWRAHHLKEFLLRMVTDRELQAKILAHPLISIPKGDKVVMPSEPMTAQEASEVIETPPTSTATYVSPNVFAEAVMSILVAESETTLYQPLRNAIEALPRDDQQSLLRENVSQLQATYTEEKLREIRGLITAIPDNTELLTALDELETALADLRYQRAQLIPLLDGVRRIRNPAFREALATILYTAEDLDEARQKIENWFDEYMNRATDAFKRKMQLISVAVALGLALLLNVDTLHLGRVLWDNGELRQRVAQIAREFDTTVVETPAEGAEVEVVPDDLTTDELLAELDENVDDLGLTLQQLFELQLPIGWEYVPVTQDMVIAAEALGLPSPYTNARNLWNFFGRFDLGLIVQKLVGILATTIAAAQGAPFWFDLLNRLTGRR